MHPTCIRHRPIAIAFSIVCLWSAPAARAAVLDLPVHTAANPVPPPCYRGDVLELQLTPAAARAVWPRAAGTTRARAVGRLGLAALDAVAASVGAVAFEPEFRGESAPSGDETDFTAFQLVHLAPGSDLAAALEALRALPEVRTAEPIALMPVSSALPNDSLVFATWWLYKDQIARTDIRAPEAWAVESGDSNIVVGILDTGVIPYHPDLGGRAGERGVMFINWAERAGTPGVDDDGNGFIDDLGGWDFVASTVSAPPAAGEDGANEDNDPNDWGGHGTACAGIIGALPGNGIGLAGVVPQVRLMPLRIGWLQSGGLPPAGTIDMSYAAAAIRYATRMGVQVLNCSWQSINQSGLDAAVSAATRAGVVLVNASGNFGTGFTYLGQREDVIAVTATDSTDAVWANAVRGPWVDLAAGGLSMTSTMFQRLSQTDSLLGRTPAYRGFINGTSFAAPQVAGAVALLQAQRRHAGLDPLTPMGANLRVRETADDISAQNPGLIGYGTGRLNLFRALTDPTRSLAIRTRGRSIGAPLVLRDNLGVVRVVQAMSDRSLLALDGATGDTLWVRPLPALPSGPLAAAQLPPPFGVVIACGTAAGTVFAFHDDGEPLPGWPRTAAAGVSLSGGVVFADIDDDGLPDIVTTGASVSTSRLWAWRVSGAPIAGYPFDPGTLGIGTPAAADLVGSSGDELVFLDGDGALRCVTSGGIEAAGFPTAPFAGARPPVIARLGGPAAALAVLVASSGALTAIDGDGATRWSVALAGNPVQDPALADLDGDGVDEIVLAMASPNAIQVRDSSGASFTARPGWPAALGAAPSGTPIVGPLKAGGEPCVAFLLGNSLAVLDASGAPVLGFPKPGGAGFAPSLDNLDADDATEIAAGTAPADSNAYIYDAGAGSWNPAAVQWPTPRGDASRRASHAHGAQPFIIDRVRPARITDLAARALSNTSVMVRFTFPGDDSLAGQVRRIEVRSYITPLGDENFNVGIQHPSLFATRPAGTLDSVLVTGLPEGSTLWFAMRAFDDVGLPSAVSNSDSAALPGLAPGAISDLRVLSVAESLAVITWTATGDDGSVGRPRDYRIAASPEALDDAAFETAPVRLRRPALYDAGRGETLEVRRLTPGRRWRFAVKAVDDAFAQSPLSNIAEAITPVGGALSGRVGLALAPRPMPATADVTVDWQGDPSGTVPQWLVVHDLSGRLVRRVALGREPGGSFKWNGRDEQQRLVPAGLYFLRLESGARHADSRVVFIR